MSQMYQVRLASSVTRTVNAGDSVSYPLRLTGILPEAELLELLRQALLRRGFAVDEGDPERLEGEGSAGERIVVDLGAKTVTASLEEESELAAEVNVAGRGYNRQQALAEARRDLAEHRRQAAARLEREGKAAERQLTRRLADSDEERRRQLHEMLQEVYAEALKRKAGQLGDVMEVREGTTSDGQYELVIKVAR